MLPADELFHAAFLDAAAEAPGLTACESFGRAFRFAELEAISGRVAAALHQLGLTDGDAVVCALPPSAIGLAILLGTFRAAGVAVAVPPEPPFVVAAARRFKPRAAFATPALVASVAPLVAGADVRWVAVPPWCGAPLTLRLVLGIAGRRQSVPSELSAMDWSTFLSLGVGNDAESGWQPGPVVVLPADGSARRWWRFGHAQLSAASLQLAAWVTDAMAGHDTWLVLRPPWTGVGLVVLLGVVARRRLRAIVLPHNQPAEIRAALLHHRPTLVLSGAAELAGILSDRNLAKKDLRFVRTWIVDQALGEELEQVAVNRIGMALCPALGDPAVAGLACCAPVNGRHVPGSVGLPLPDVEARIVTGDRRLAATDEWGQLEMRGPNFAVRGWRAMAPQARMDGYGFVHLGPSRGDAVA